jgi:hypothetical protein
MPVKAAAQRDFVLSRKQAASAAPALEAEMRHNHDRQLWREGKENVEYGARFVLSWNMLEDAAACRCHPPKMASAAKET